jgi:hypothetical protein
VLFWVSAGTKWSYLADSFAADFPATAASNDSLATIVVHGKPHRSMRVDLPESHKLTARTAHRRVTTV